MSPWTHRAHFALMHAQVPYETVEYSPPMDLWLMRWKLMRWFITMPVLQPPGQRPIPDSFEIAQWADSNRAEGVAPLTAHESVEQWVHDVEQLLCTQRYACARRWLCSLASPARCDCLSLLPVKQ
jgi:glutathione S-transferase